MTPSCSSNSQPAPHGRFRLSSRTWKWAVGCLLANLAAFAAFQFTRQAPVPVWLHMLVYSLPLVLALVAGVTCLFNLGRDLLQIENRTAVAADCPHRRRGLLWDALQIGSPKWSVGIVLVSVAAFNLDHITGLPQWLRVLIAITPLVPIAMYLRSTSQKTAEVDELALHIRREAYGFAYWALTGIIVCVQSLQNAGVIPDFSWGPQSLVVIMLALLIVGAAISRRSFR